MSGDYLKQISVVVNEEPKAISSLTWDELRRLTAIIIRESPFAGKWWDVITCMRGPDSPSERPDMSGDEASVAYKGRRDRKFKTVEILRQVAWFGACGGAARHHADTKVILPPSSRWDHFDKHVMRAANALGLEIKEEK